MNLSDSVAITDMMVRLGDCPVRMRDGVHLATDVYLPAVRTGPLPVVIERTPYNKRAQSRSEVNADGARVSREMMAEAFVARGFAVVFQDCRGRYASEGVFTKYTSEGVDGVDTLSWILRQPWCDGHIGSMGLSYAAHTQLAMACLNPPGLQTMVLDSGGFSSAYRCGIRQGGAFELKQATWAFKQAKLSPEAQANSQVLAALEQENIHHWFAAMPWLPGHSPLRHVPHYEQYLFEQWSQGNFSDYWRQNGIYAAGSYEAMPDIPVLFMSSWYDAYVSSTLDNFRAFCDRKTAPQRLIMGPWLHGDRNISYSGDVEFGEAARFDGQLAESWLECRLQWFEQWLKPGTRVQPQRHQVSVFAMGGGSGRQGKDGRMEHGGTWVHDTQWPLRHSQAVTFYLHPDTRLSAEPVPGEQQERRYVADPHHPVPTIGGAITSGLPVFAGGAFDQRESPQFFGSRGDHLPLSARADILVFQTDPLEADLWVAGEIRVYLRVASDAPDTDFTAKLVDVYPPNDDYPQGYAMNISDGIIRCRYRHSWEDPELMTPGEQTGVLIEPFATCNVFRKGHRLRLDIASSNFPRFDCNPNSGEAEGQGRLKRAAINSLFLGGEMPSRLELTVVVR